MLRCFRKHFEEDKMACKLTFWAFRGIFTCVYCFVFSRSFGFLGIQKCCSYVKSEFEFFCLFRGLTIYSLGIQKNSNSNNKTTLLFFAFPLTSVLFQFLFHGVFWSWFRPHYFFSDLYGYVSESEVARILDEWYAAT